ncbi:hypothetical protein [Mesomycoplasma ovipneumoniae]|uniref:hypothetical protein n=1 Tax=Mesomycoplasma ovipneumoniae TaxID=29562 RepID=UPI0028AE1037|nr:hypothetical protein [Mesomycoplasma ovipneumoniae]WNM13192.1 hypothetical protein RNL84_02290 [Mesomycoplasma ovipneumoniae]
MIIKLYFRFDFLSIFIKKREDELLKQGVDRPDLKYFSAKINWEEIDFDQTETLNDHHHLKDRETIKVYGPISGFCVIITTQAYYQVNTRVLKFLPKLKTIKIKNLCTV